MHKCTTPPPPETGMILPVLDLLWEVCLSFYVLYMSLQEEKLSIKDKFSTIHKPVTVGSQQQVTVGTTHISKLTDEQLIKEFLSGSYCFHGVRKEFWLVLCLCSAMLSLECIQS